LPGDDIIRFAPSLNGIPITLRSSRRCLSSVGATVFCRPDKR
jgi:hypothetical protein